MKKLFLIFALALVSLSVSAVPAKPGLWRTLTLDDGTEVRARLMGDEHAKFWLAENGQQYTIQADGTVVEADLEQLQAHALARRSITRQTTAKRLRAPQRVVIGQATNYKGKKKGLVVLMEFTDTKFKAANDQAKFNDILNKENYVTGAFKGSVADYFKAQSNGQFVLEFDVVGPYTAKKNYSYYGSNNTNGDDKHPDELIVEAVKAADSEVDFNDYDWDGDGEVDQVFIMYAGKGEATSGVENTIWPHMWYLSESSMQQTLDGVIIDTYACANEVTPSGSFEGIGCFCHEFSHCLGYPDFYDTSYSGWFGMSQFDLMDAGSYNGDCYRPAGYSAYEKWMAGWLEPTVLGEQDLMIENIVPLSESGPAYVMYNDAHSDEYYMIENRQKTSWDTDLPANGLMITHVDFDAEIWAQNTPNTKVTSEYVQWGYYAKTNDHQRHTIFHADNNDDSKYWNSSYGYYTKQTLTNDLYPYNSNDSLTATSKPAATLFNANSKGKKVMEGSILNIKQNSDKTMSFLYRATLPEEKTDPDPEEKTDPDKPYVAHGDTLFMETFDKCDGKGGNDGNWSTTIATSSSKFHTDNAGWEYNAAYAGYKCARFGNGSKLGTTTTPLFTIDGEATLTFRATAWNNDGTMLAISASCETPETEVSIEPSTLTMDSFSWKDFTVILNGTGNIRLTFIPEKRFLLDEVLVIANRETPPLLYGDVNGDGEVDVSDIAFIIDIMSGKETGNATATVSADVNGDGTVNVADVAVVIDIMSGYIE